MNKFGKVENLFSYFQTQNKHVPAHSGLNYFVHDRCICFKSMITVTVLNTVVSEARQSGHCFPVVSLHEAPRQQEKTSTVKSQ